MRKKKTIKKNRIVNKPKSKKQVKTSLKPKVKVKKPKKLKKNKKPVVTPPPVVVVIPPPTTKRRKKSSDKMYFTQDTENSVVLFNKTECMKAREKIFEEKVKYPFEKLVENVFNTFKFSYFETGPLDVQKETVSHLVANIHKYDPTKGKAFAYFSIVAKHYLIFLNNSNYKRFNQQQEIGEDREEHVVQLQAEDKYYKQSEMSEFMKLMIDYWEDNVGKIFSKQRDLNIANAVIELFRNSDRIDAFNKKALYLYIREISNCKTQQITKVINKMKSCHINITRAYQDTGMILNPIKA
jgi:hypothetical protein